MSIMGELALNKIQTLYISYISYSLYFRLYV